MPVFLKILFIDDFQKAEQWIKDSTVLVLKDYLYELKNGNSVNIERNGRQ